LAVAVERSAKTAIVGVKKKVLTGLTPLCYDVSCHTKHSKQRERQHFGEENACYMKHNSRLHKRLSRRSNKKDEQWHLFTTDMGSLVDVSALNFEPKPQIKKISKNMYVMLQTGEVREMLESNGRNKRSLRVIFRELRQTITANFSGDNEKMLFVTLTYAENMQDEKRLYSDFESFMKRLKRYAVRCDLGSLEYLVVMEPQGRGAWHAHLMLKSDVPLYIHYADMEKLWGHGATRTERLENINNIGAYFIAYFSNVEITDENASTYHVDADDIVVRDGKKYIKGERMQYYPDYMQIWRHSRGIKRPITQKDLEDIMKSLEEPHLTREYEIKSSKETDEKPLFDYTLKIKNSQHRKK